MLQNTAPTLKIYNGSHLFFLTVHSPQRHVRVPDFKNSLISRIVLYWTCCIVIKTTRSIDFGAYLPGRDLRVSSFPSLPLLSWSLIPDFLPGDSCTKNVSTSCLWFEFLAAPYILSLSSPLPIGSCTSCTLALNGMFPFLVCELGIW